NPFRLGQVPFAIVVTSLGPPSYLPLRGKRIFVPNVLVQNGLLMELILLVLDFMGCGGASQAQVRVHVQVQVQVADWRYAQERELLATHDPLHPANREASGDYLEQCWS
ncbi:hypothetical protein BJX62DRAFT_245727, partial [Aspergillus germanicus]